MNSSQHRSDRGFEDAHGHQTDNHMELVEDGMYFCSHCGTQYNWRSQEPPENATFHWVPSCPDCNSNMTCDPTSRLLLQIVSDSLDSDDENYEHRVNQLNAYARLYHGRMAGLSAEELVTLALWFDRQATAGRAYGPRYYRSIAFALRRQAREKLTSN